MFSQKIFHISFSKKILKNYLLVVLPTSVVKEKKMKKKGKYFIASYSNLLHELVLQLMVFVYVFGYKLEPVLVSMPLRGCTFQSPEY